MLGSRSLRACQLRPSEKIRMARASLPGSNRMRNPAAMLRKIHLALQQPDCLQHCVAHNLQATRAELVQGVLRRVVVGISGAVFEIDQICNRNAETREWNMIVLDLHGSLEKVALMATHSCGLRDDVQQPGSGIEFPRDVQISISYDVEQHTRFDLLQRA